jgi:hypothetical protein
MDFVTVPACFGTALQQLWPWAVMYLTSFSSSSGDHSPRFTFCLLQQWCPMVGRPLLSRLPGLSF